MIARIMGAIVVKFRGDQKVDHCDGLVDFFCQSG